MSLLTELIVFFLGIYKDAAPTEPKPAERAYLVLVIPSVPL